MFTNLFPSFTIRSAEPKRQKRTHSLLPRRHQLMAGIPTVFERMREKQRRHDTSTASNSSTASITSKRPKLDADVTLTPINPAYNDSDVSDVSDH